MNSGLLALQVRSLAGLQQHHSHHQQLPSPMSSSPKSCDSLMINGNQHHSPSPSPIRSPPHTENNNNNSSRNNNFNSSLGHSDNSNIDIEDTKPIYNNNRSAASPNVVTF